MFLDKAIDEFGSSLVLELFVGHSNCVQELLPLRSDVVTLRGREGQREGRMEGGREGRREGGKRERGREGGREAGKEGGRGQS